MTTHPNTRGPNIAQLTPTRQPARDYGSSPQNGFDAMRHLAALGFLLLLLSGCAGNQTDAKPRQLVYFTEWSAKLDEPAQKTLEGTAALINRTPAGSVTVIGFADPEGSNQANLALSRARAQNVVDALVAAGVSPNRIRRLAQGETPFVGDAIESRRVEIIYDAP